MADFNPLCCCAVTELDGIAFRDDAEGIVKEVVEQYYRSPRPEQRYDYKKHQYVDTGKMIPESWNPPAFLLFTESNDDDQERQEYGQELKAYIKKHKLGSTVSIGPAWNRNSDFEVSVFVWQVDADGLKKWGIEHNLIAGGKKK